VKSSPCEARSSYLGFVVHEFRNPLATALWCAQLLGRLGPEERGGARGMKLAATAQRAMARVGRLLEDHFLAERLEAGGLPQRPEPLELGAVARAAAEAAGVAEATFAVPAALLVTADRLLLARCLEAAVAAAGKEGAPVRIEASVNEGGLAVRIAGAPVAPEALERPSRGAASDPSGRALGLFAARVAAEALGAELATDAGALVLSLPGRGG